MNSLTDVWGSVLQQMSQQLAPTTINTWFDEVDVVTMEDSAFVLHCGNEFKKKTIETRFLSYIRDALRDLFSADFEIKILNDDQLSAYHGIKPDYPGDLEDSGTFTFETYVVGPSNKLAYAAAHAVSDRPGVNYNPLFIYGDSGLGKTHLLYAIAHGLKQNYPDAKVVYIKGDDFTNELVASIREGKNAEFREKYRQATLLLVDDVQFIAGKEQTQEEFFHTFNSLYEAGKQIVLTSDRPPREMTKLEDRLRTRFAPDQTEVFLFDGKPAPRLYWAGQPMLERLLSQDVGATLGYCAEKGGIVRVRTARQPAEPRIAQIQSGVRRFAAAWRDSVLNGQPIPPQRAIAPFLRLVESPTALQLDLLGDLTVEDGGTYPLAAPQHTAHYLTHPRQARRDFAEARWKIGFLQRAVPLPLPYGKLYLKLKK